MKSVLRILAIGALIIIAIAAIVATAEAAGPSASVSIEGANVVARDESNSVIFSAPHATGDADAIHAALDYLTKTNNVLTINPGTYTIDKTIVISGFTNLRINGAGATIKECNNYAGYYDDQCYGVYVTSDSYLSMYDLTFDGNNATQINEGTVVNFNHVDDSWVHNCTFTHAKYKIMAIRRGESNNLTFDYCRYIDNALDTTTNSDDVYISPAADGVHSTSTFTFQNCVWSRYTRMYPGVVSPGQALYVQSGNGYYYNNTFINMQKCYDFRNGVHTVVDAYGTDCGIAFVTYDGQPTASMTNATFTGLTGADYWYDQVAGIWLTGGTVTLDNVTITSSGGPASQDGIRIDGTYRPQGPVTVHNCSISGFGYDGIAITGTDGGHELSENTITNCGSYGINSAGNSGQSTATANTITGCTIQYYSPDGMLTTQATPTPSPGSSASVSIEGANVVARNESDAVILSAAHATGDADAIQAAVDYLSKTNSVLTINSGNYTTSHGILVKGFTNLRINGAGAAIIMKNNYAPSCGVIDDQYYGMYFWDNTGLDVRDLTVDANKYNQIDQADISTHDEALAQYEIVTVNWNNCDNSYVSNVTFARANKIATAIRRGDSSNLTFYNCHYIDNCNNGTDSTVYISTDTAGSSDLVWRNCDFSKPELVYHQIVVSGFYASSCISAYFFNNTFTGYESCYDLRNGNYWIDGTYGDNNGVGLLNQLGSPNVTMLNTRWTNVTGIPGTLRAGTFIVNADHVTIDNMTCIAKPGSAGALWGAYIASSNAQNVQISNSRIEGFSDTAGVYVLNTPGNHYLTNNTIIGTGAGFGIVSQGNTGPIYAQGNLISGVATQYSNGDGQLVITADTRAQFYATSYSVNENAGKLTVRVDCGAVGAAQINYATVDGTAKAGVDYTATSGTLYFTASNHTAYFDVPISNIIGAGSDRSFSIVQSAPVGCTIGSPSSVTVTIHDVGGNQYLAPAGYSYGRDHVILGSSDGALTNYQIKLTLYNITGTSIGNKIYLGAHSLTDGFYDVWINGSSDGADNGIRFPMWATNYTSNSVDVWVNVTDTIPRNGVYILKIYYGKAGEPNPYSIANTFYAGDEFGTAPGAAYYTIGGSPSVSGGILTLPSGAYIESKKAFAPGYSLMYRATYAAGTMWGGWESSAGALSPYIDVVNQSYVVYGNGVTGGAAAHGLTLTSEYNLIDVARTSGHTRFYVNGALVRDETSIVSSDQRKPIFYGNSGNLLVDYFAVRAYTMNEPGHGMTGGENGSVSAAFTASVTTGTAPLLVTFVDTSTGTPTSWQWNFGDGTANSSSQNPPAHTYDTAGTYTAMLTVANSYGSWTVTTTITVGVWTPPESGFTMNKTSGQVPVCIQFNDTSEGDPESWSWDFGDGAGPGEELITNGDFETNTAGWTIWSPGGTATLTRSTAWSYNGSASCLFSPASENGYEIDVEDMELHAGDMFTVSLWIKSPSDQDIVLSVCNKTDYTRLATTTASFTAGEEKMVTFSGSTAVNQTVYFSILPGVGFYMDYVHLTVGAVEPNEIFNSDFETNVSGGWTIWSPGGTATLNQSTNWSDTGSSSALIDMKEEGGIEVDVNDLNIHAGDSFSIVIRVNATTAGSVRFSLSNTSDYHSLGRTTVSFAAGEEKTVSFAASTAEDQTVYLSIVPAATNMVFYMDNVRMMDDGGESIQNPSHVYTDPGEYTVTLVSVNDAGTNSYQQTVTALYPSTPVSSFTANVTSGVAPLCVAFTDTSSSNPTAWQWDFGDGSTSASQSPVHTYASAGTYTVTLTTNNSQGTGTTATAKITGLTDSGEYERDHVIIGSPDSALSNYQVKLTLHNTTGTSSDDDIYLGSNVASTMFYDVHVNGTFVNGTDNGISFPMWATNYTSNSVDVWVNITDMIHMGGNYILKIYYGGTSIIAPNPYNIWTTFPIADDYSGSPSASNYTIGGSPSVSDGILTLTGGAYIESKTGFGSGYAVMALAKYYRTSNQSEWIGWESASPTNPIAKGIDVIDPWFVNYGNNVTGGAAAHGLTYTLTSAYNIVEVGRSLNHTKFYIAGALARDETTLVSVDTRKAILSSGVGGTAGTLLVDWMAVRKTTANEPTHGITGAENSSAPVASAPVAIIGADKVNGTAPLVIQFADMSTGSPTAWDWEFGDGTSSYSTAPPAHTFTVPGTYVVTLTVSNEYGSSMTSTTITVTGIIDVSVPATAYVREDASVVTIPITAAALVPCSVDYTTSGGTAVDGVNYTAVSGTALFDGTNRTFNVSIPITDHPTTAGNTTFYFILTDPSGCSVTNGITAITIYDEVSTLDASFSADVTNGVAPLTVHFTDSSTGNPTSWEWDFGDGSGEELCANGDFETDVTGWNVWSPGSSATLTRSTVWSYSGTASALFDPASEPGAEISVSNLGLIAGDAFNVSLRVNATSAGDITFFVANSDDYTRLATTTVSFLAGEEKTVNFTGNTTTDQNVYFSIQPGVGFYMDDVHITIPGNSTEQNPAHTYAAPGSYNVTLTVSNDDGSDTLESVGYIYVYGTDVSAEFTSDVTSGYAPLSVQFYDQSTNAEAWHWDFGDGSTDSTANPVHMYATAGTYTVTLDVVNSGSTDRIVKTNYVTVLNQSVIAAFVMSPTTGPFPLAVQFTDLSTNATAWQWDFGDGASSSLRNPTHTYNTTGIYTIMLTASNGYVGNTTSHTVTVTAPQVTPQFTANTTNGYVPLSVKFTDQSLNATAWQWNFGDGTANSTTQSPTHTYMTPGTYTVTLTSSNAYNSHTLAKVSYITVRNRPVTVDFGVDPTTPRQGIAPMTVHFLDASTNATSWSWDFGDGNTSTLQNPTHTYAVGTYTVTLTVQYAYNTNQPLSVTKIGYVSAGIAGNRPVAEFTADVTSGYPQLTVQFTDLSTGTAATSWWWDFGDGQYSTEQNPTHVYRYSGLYAVGLTAANSYGGTTTTKAGYIDVWTIVTPTPPPYGHPSPTPPPDGVGPGHLPVASSMPHALNTTYYTEIVNRTINTNLSTSITNVENGSIVGAFMNIYVWGVFNGDQGPFWMIIFGFPALLLFWRSRSPFLPSMALLIMTKVVWDYVPGNWQLAIIACDTLAVVGVVYAFFMAIRRT